jgi:hypothetical protein
MVDVLQVLSLVLVVLAMVPALAHVLELPGKLRLTKDAYFAVQPIYYPGFTVAGISEPIAIIATIILSALTPRGSADFWLTLASLLGLVAMHAVYWLFTHPVNNFWVQGQNLSGLGTRFFSVGSGSGQGRQSDTRPAWTDLRDRWEHSHVARAGLAFLSFVALAVAISRSA